MMRVCKLVSGLFCVITMLAAGTAWADPASPQMTADQALLIARDFCRRIGAPVTVQGTAKFPVAARPIYDPPEPDMYWLPRWEVDFPNQATVQVVDETGIVSDYENQIWQFNLPSPPPSGGNITPDQAASIAVDALRRTGQPMNELVLSLVHPDPTPALPSSTWYVEFDRVFKGIPYEGQGAGALIQYRGGRLDGLTLNFPSPPCAPSSMRFDAGHAAQKALARLAQRGVQTALIYQEDAEYVVPDETQPNGAPTADSAAPNESHPSGTIHTGASPTDFVVPRLAWIARAMTDEAPMDEWIDAETGDVIGETTHLFAGHAAPPKGRKTAAEILSDAKDITIERRTDKYAWPKKPTATISATSQPKVFKLLQASQPSPMNHLMVAPKFQLVVTTSDKRPTTLYYLPDRNLVGNGVDWLTPPAGFQKWMEKLDGNGARHGMK